MSPLRVFPHADGPRRHRQSGASLIEFSIVAVPILLAGLGGVDIAAWFFTRQAASLALLEAGRAGVVGHAHPDAMVQAFEQALLPLFPAASSQASRQKLQTALHKRATQTGRAPWQIEILSPTPDAYRDFADRYVSVPGQGTLAAINNNYQQEQDLERRGQGWTQGRGPVSGASIFQANTLVLRLSYLHEPVLPGMKSLMRMLGRENGSYRQHALARGYLPMVREIALGMQSHPVDWPLPSSGKIVKKQSAPQKGSPAASACVGVQCAAASPDHGGPAPNPPLAPAYPDPGGMAHTGPTASPPADNAPPPGSEHLAVSLNDPACGVTLCCVPA
jgi:hypothetical protein